MATLTDSIAGYREYLAHQSGDPARRVLKHFGDRLSANPDAGRGEAATFSFLRQSGLNPLLLEDPTTGGMDFECSCGDQAFAIEVTAFGAETVAERSGLPIQVHQGGGSYAGTALVPLIRSRISTKAQQARTYPGPRILVITSSHSAAGVLFSNAAAQVLTGEAKISIDLGPVGATEDAYMSTELRNAAYLRTLSGVVQPFRDWYAHIILMAVHGEGSDLWGISHPQPSLPLSPDVFPEVPFARLRWPLQDDTLHVEWTNGGPKPLRFSFASPIRQRGKSSTGAA